MAQVDFCPSKVDALHFVLHTGTPADKERPLKVLHIVKAQLNISSERPDDW